MGTYDGETARIYVDGLLADSVAAAPPPALAEPTPLYIGGAPHCLDVAGDAIDDVLILDRPLTADEVYRRAHPLPRVRFLASTAVEPRPDGRHPWRSYRLWWGDPEIAGPAAPVEGLLSPGHGWLGYWRFDEQDPLVAVDRTTQRLHGRLVGPAEREAAPGGTALRLAGPGRVIVDTGPGVIAPIEGLTLEVIAALDDPAHGSVVDQDFDGASLGLALAADGFSCAVPLAVRPAAAEAALALGAWTQVGCTLDAQALAAWQGRTMLADNDLQGLDLAFGDPTGPLVFGANVVGGAPWTGRIAAVRLSNRALPPAAMLHQPFARAAASRPLPVDEPCMDADGDGVDVCDTDAAGEPSPVDCNDHLDTVSPEAPEVCDGVDNDCDGFVDGEDEDLPHDPDDPLCEVGGVCLNSDEACVDGR